MKVVHLSAVVLALALVGEARSQTISVDLKDGAGSKVGSATIEPLGSDRTRVTIALNYQGVYLASIRGGVCSDMGGIYYRLNDVRNRTSITDLDVRVAKFRPGSSYAPLALNVERGACGDFTGSPPDE